METTLIARKDWSNAAAFIECNPENGKVRVYGKFYMDEGWRRRGYGGPITEILGTVPSELLAEAKKIGWRDQKTPQLAAFCEDIFTKAKEVEPWFGY